MPDKSRPTSSYYDLLLLFSASSLRFFATSLQPDSAALRTVYGARTET